ncbi:hypothetical protein QCD60_14175 [Pokkaliibacter sp. MBI-7]|uniref:hypothetical protein n=1 Tax=Pokkaliibacter sp. MBI-7 TaxID=3040600 RepID=UPI00244CE481|nr:hypothetical protein [Pokkaliibacter sp. MBI-7]MDH2433715.1 hypothetical protein [Pokkaliibacter sp. MBI-7]
MSIFCKQGIPMRKMGLRLCYMLPLVLAGCVSQSEKPQSAQPLDSDGIASALIGPIWNCTSSATSRGVTTSFDTQDMYVRGGAGNATGTMKIKNLAGIPEMIYSLAATFTWEVKGQYVFTKSVDIKLVNVTHPDIEKTLKLSEMLPAGMSNSLKVVALNEHEFTYIDESDGKEKSCTR